MEKLNAESHGWASVSLKILDEKLKLPISKSHSNINNQTEKDLAKWSKKFITDRKLKLLLQVKNVNLSTQ